MAQQFYQLTLKDAIADYQEGALTAYGLVKYYIRVKFKEGWKININPIKVAQQLGLKLSTFYRALKKIKQVFCDRYIVLISEKEITNSENNFLKFEKINCQSENQKLETSNKIDTSSDLPDIRSDIDHISLSNEAIGDWQLAVSSKPKPKAKSQIPIADKEEREKFLTFAYQKVDELPKRPTLPKKWITANFDDLYSEFKLQSAPVAQKNNLDAQFPEWYDLMRQLGHVVGEQVKDGKRLVQKFGSDYWLEYEEMSQRWTLDYLRKCVKGR